MTSAKHWCGQDERYWALSVTGLAPLPKPLDGKTCNREPSGKIFAGQGCLTEIGYRPGVPASCGRRNLIDQNGIHGTELSGGEHKSIRTDRVIFIPGMRLLQADASPSLERPGDAGPRTGGREW